MSTTPVPPVPPGPDPPPPPWDPPAAAVARRQASSAAALLVARARPGLGQGGVASTPRREEARARRSSRLGSDAGGRTAAGLRDRTGAATFHG